mmetsp:Transcript_44675/g.87512  ORF Transcript_44675/g.87512 Transcript_44675/m.87512 type:complete len:449 (-) Transcript_44675:86-1432(-)
MNYGKNYVSPSWMPKGYDIYVLAVQELHYKVKDKAFKETEAHWIHSVQTHLGEEYTVMHGASMWEIRIVLLVRDVLEPFVSNLEGGHVATGVANTLKNKGGIGVSFNLFGTSMAFVNMHLAARPDIKRLKLRNKNAEDILKHIKLGGKGAASDPLNHFHVCTVLGDLNYRIKDTTREAEYAMIDKCDWAGLVRLDQLCQQRAQGQVLWDMEEMPITFRPSYRYMTKSDEWSNKKLVNLPSYCDRVLTRSHPGINVQKGEYSEVMQVFGSDHRPVFLSMLVPVDLPLSQPDVCQQVELAVVRMYGLVLDIHRSAGATAQTPKAITLNSPYLPQPVIVAGDFVFHGEAEQDKSWQAVGRLPEGHVVTGRFVADDIVTFSLGYLNPIDLARLALTLSVVFRESPGSAGGHGVISLRDVQRGEPACCGGHVTLHGLPVGCFAADIVIVQSPE